MIALLFDHLWQSSLFVGGAGLTTLALRRNNASARFWLWFAGSVKFLIPFAVLAAAGNYFQTPIAVPLPSFALTMIAPVGQPFTTPTPVLTLTRIATASAPSHLNVAAVLLALWVLGFFAIIIRWIVRWSQLRRLLRNAVSMSINAPVLVKSSPSRFEPGLVGIIRPVILLPQGIDEQLSSPELNAVLAHELCHWHRRDNLFAAVHMVVEALFWFFPLVWWLGARLNAERERACDEGVLAAGNDAKTYAEGILKVCRVYLQSPLPCVAGVSGAGLKKRIEAIMADDISVPLGSTKKVILVAMAGAAIVAPVCLGLLVTPSAFAQAQTPGPHPGTEAAIRVQIQGWETRRPVTGDMTDPLAEVTQRQQATTQLIFDGLGALQSIVFKGRDNDIDVYLTTFAHGTLTWSIAPLVDGKISSLSFAPAIIRPDNNPSAGTEDALRQLISGLATGKPDYEIMTSETINATVRQQSALEATTKALGALKTLTFKQVNPRGWDTYDAVYENGDAEWEIQPLVDGKVAGIFVTNAIITNAKPHPDREASLRRYIEALEDGAPNYDDMAPGLAAMARAQESQSLKVIKSLGKLQSIDFEHGTANGLDVYLATFEHGKLEWMMGALTSDGKAQARGWRLL